MYMATTLMTSHLRNWYQQTKVNRAFSDWIELLTGIPYGFILGPLLFNIYLSTSYYTDENTDVVSWMVSQDLGTQYWINAN